MTACYGRIPLEDIIEPETGAVICKAGEIVDEEMSKRINDSTIETILIRSVLTCESERGVCCKCYGLNLAKGDRVNIGEAVGVIAAQSIGEPGTQLTLRTFHIGGAGSRMSEQSEIQVKKGGTVVFGDEMRLVPYAKEGEQENAPFHVVTSRNSEIFIDDETGHTISTYQVPYGSRLTVKNGDTVADNQTLYTWEPNHTLIVLMLPVPFSMTMFSRVRLSVTRSTRKPVTNSVLSLTRGTVHSRPRSISLIRMAFSCGHISSRSARVSSSTTMR